MACKKLFLAFICFTVSFCGQSFASWGDKTHEYIMETMAGSGLYKSAIAYSYTFNDNSNNVIKMNLKSAALSLDEPLIERILSSVPASLMDSKEYFFAEGIKYYLEGNYSQSIGALSICIDKDPFDVYSWYYMAKDYELSNNYNSANFTYQKAISLEPNNLAILKSYAKFLRLARLTDQYNIVIKHIRDIYSRDSDLEISWN
ncbi:Tetratricopeptide TPR_2 repeat-containing protein [Thermodesulfobium narugense DSM 14796]|uniref:Tetratricopeptide TPR_2 repeat-containing protein n=1 Tax=Thermodesulfobium narugense DSM 14796 TaxID=747365 RepID=M1E4L0_9BACT|nr:tetratricopeptide repeat protein [Thermodesulfobium narugense]AEE14267.1 Tetratricopeptide TPR_2 repeat-containing protein [Thermodesulfobium narugense DSM 14796]